MAATETHNGAARNLSTAREFLAMIDPAADTFCFQWFGATEAAKKREEARHRTGKFDNLSGLLQDCNDREHDIYVVINETDGKGREKKNIIRVRAVFADFDNTLLLDTWPIKPHCITETSPGKFQVFWKVNGLSVEEFKPTQQSIAAMFGSDRSISDESRVMRLPGFFHQKGERFLSRIVEINDHAPFTAEEILAVFPLPEKKPRAQRRTEVNRGSYGNTAQLFQLNTLRNAQNGQRNDTLNTTAFSLGQLVGGGELDSGTVEDELLAAALDIGLSEIESRGTIRSGLTAGMAQPRSAPEGCKQSARPIAAEDKTIANFSFVEVNGETRREAIPLPEILDHVDHLTQHWPRSASSVLFAAEGARIRYLEKPENLFSYLGEKYPVRWGTGNGYDGQTLTPKGEFFSSVAHNARAYDTIEVLPHEPVLPRAYYAYVGDTDYKPTGEYMNKLCTFFNNAETPIDRALIRAMAITPAWGGLPGMRPGFAVVAPDRGCGKTALTGAIAQIYGGIEIEPDGGNEERIVSRLLSPNALTQRTVRIDNIKRCVSSGTLESLITGHTISGHRLYHGDASRPNYLTWLLTGNSMRLSRDISERCFIIRLARPTPRPRWNEDLYKFIEANRTRIVADAIQELKAPPCQHAARDRWQSWVDNVLARVIELPESVTQENQKRRGDFDEDVEEAALIASALRGKSEGFISAADAAAMLETVLRVKFTTKRSTQIIIGHIEAQRLPGITPVRTRTERGFSVTHVTHRDTSNPECVTLEESKYE